MEYYIAFIGYAFALLASPGPNNMILMIVSSHHGARSTIGQLLGIWSGFSLLILLSALGIMAILSANQMVFEVVKYVGLGYILYLSYKLSSIKSLGSSDKEVMPITYPEAFVLQFSNPKGWIIAISSVSAFWMDEQSFVFNIINILLVLIIISIISNGIWVFLGEVIKRHLKTNQVKIITNTMAIILAVSAIYVTLID